MRNPRFASSMVHALLVLGLVQMITAAKSPNPECPASLGRPANNHQANKPVNYGIDYKCMPNAVPSAWQKPNADDTDGQFDVAIVGAGIGATYLISRIQEQFEAAGKPLPKIALLERQDMVGGRLMSGSETGALNLAVPSVDNPMHPIPEYGGMRVDPTRYPYIFSAIVKLSRAVDGPDCLSPKDCPIGGNCCPAMLAPMNVGSIQFHTTDPKMPAYLRKSNLAMPSKLYSIITDQEPCNKSSNEFKDKICPSKVTVNYDASHLAKWAASDDPESAENEVATPYDNCLQITQTAARFYNNGPNSMGVSGKDMPSLWKDAVDGMCTDCKLFDGLCKLCEVFEHDASRKMARAAIQCSGYDMDVETLPSAAILGLTDEVTNADGGTHLYVVRSGLQRFAEMLMTGKGNSIPVAPIFGKDLDSVQTPCGLAGTRDLARAQVNAIGKSNENSTMKCNKPGPLMLRFKDGSAITAKAAYITMLPHAMPDIKELKYWRNKTEQALPRSTAIKVVMGWNNANESLSSLMNFTACIPGPCQRMLLSGEYGTQVVRQVWFWDDRKLMVYVIAPEDEAGKAYKELTFPANKLLKMPRREGMDAVVNLIMEEINKAVKATDPSKTLQMPDWARLKTWDSGNLAIGWKTSPDGLPAMDSDPNDFGGKMSRPLGIETPLYYANSEAAPRGDLHGWMEGALTMIEANMRSLLDDMGAEDVPYVDPILKDYY